MFQMARVLIRLVVSQEKGTESTALQHGLEELVGNFSLFFFEERSGAH
jgi:hypothetical protein